VINFSQHQCIHQVQQLIITKDAEGSVCDNFKIISQHLGGGSKENHDTLQSGEVVFQKQIRSITASATLLFLF
jgi:hypothetical protein